MLITHHGDGVNEVFSNILFLPFFLGLRDETPF